MAGDNGQKDPLHQIVEHLSALRTEMKHELTAVRTEISDLRGDMNRRFAAVDVSLTQVNLRLDKLIENTGTHYRKLEERDAVLESKVH